MLRRVPHVSSRARTGVLGLVVRRAWPLELDRRPLEPLHHLPFPSAMSLAGRLESLQWVTGCRSQMGSATAGCTQIAADWCIRRFRQPWAKCGSVTLLGSILWSPSPKARPLLGFAEFLPPTSRAFEWSYRRVSYRVIRQLVLGSPTSTWRRRTR